MKKVLFICIGNSGRSQMAEAFLNQFAGRKAMASSAGTMPARQVDPNVVELMKEEEIDISSSKPRQLTDEMLQEADKVITMGCAVEEACPAIRVHSEDWGLSDPKGKSKKEIRKIRDEIKDRVMKLLQEIV
jgi:arsenate reductase (thioredoxin)